MSKFTLKPIFRELEIKEGDYAGVVIVMRADISLSTVQRIIDATRDEGVNFAELASTLAGVISEWNLVDENESPLPLPDQESVMLLPFNLVIDIANLLATELGNVSPKSKSG